MTCPGPTGGAGWESFVWPRATALQKSSEARQNDALLASVDSREKLSRGAVGVGLALPVSILEMIDVFVLLCISKSPSLDVVRVCARLRYKRRSDGRSICHRVV